MEYMEHAAISREIATELIPYFVRAMDSPEPDGKIPVITAPRTTKVGWHPRGRTRQSFLEWLFIINLIPDNDQAEST